MSVATFLRGIAIVLLVGRAACPVSDGHSVSGSPYPAYSGHANRAPGSWGIGEVSWTKPPTLQTKKGQTAVLTVAVSASFNISDTASVTLTYKILQKPVTANLTFSSSPAEYVITGSDLKHGHSTFREFTVVFTKEPAAEGIYCIGRASLVNPSEGTTVDEPGYVDGNNTLIVCPKSGCARK